MQNVRSNLRRLLPLFALLTAASGLLSACDTPTGVSPLLKGTYWEHAIVTNPDGKGPMVVRWGPPVNFIPSGNP